jgi:hypothetical protein
MIATSIGRNEVVVDLCRSPNIQTRLVLSQRSQKRRPSLWRAREPTAVIDIISRQIRFMVGIPRQRGTPCRARPQYKNSSDCSCPVHTDTSLYIPQPSLVKKLEVGPRMLSFLHMAFRLLGSALSLRQKAFETGVCSKIPTLRGEMGAYFAL